MVSSVLASKRGGPAGSLACHRRSRASGSARTCTCAHSGQFGRRQVIDGAVGSLLLLPDLRTHRSAIAAEDPVAESPADVAAEAAPSDSPPLEADPSAAPVVEDLALTGPPPASWNVVEDVYDQYTIVLPQDWSQVTTAGYDLSFRNIRNVEQNMFIELSSKSFSKFRSLPQDFGSPDEVSPRRHVDRDDRDMSRSPHPPAPRRVHPPPTPIPSDSSTDASELGDSLSLSWQCAQIWLKKYLEEFTSTRLGIQRSGRVIATMERKNEQGGWGPGISNAMLCTTRSHSDSLSLSLCAFVGCARRWREAVLRPAPEHR